MLAFTLCSPIAYARAYDKYGIRALVGRTLLKASSLKDDVREKFVYLTNYLQSAAGPVAPIAEEEACAFFDNAKISRRTTITSA